MTDDALQRRLLETRLDAIRGLVHDLSNGLLGLRSMAESCSFDIPQGHPARESVDWLLESLGRTESTLQLLRSAYREQSETMPLLEPVVWLKRHQAVLEGMTLRGQRMQWELPERLESIPVEQHLWRDSMLLIAASASREAPEESQICWKLGNRGEACRLEVSYPVGAAPATDGDPAETLAVLSALHGNGRSNFARAAEGESVCLRLEVQRQP